MSSTPTAPADGIRNDIFGWVALGVAGLTSLGSMYLTLGMGLYACPLCFYQRAFVLGTFGVLLLGLLFGMRSRVSVATLAMPLAIAGLSVALRHTDLERKGIMECPAGLFGLGSAPTQSAVAFAVLCIALLLDGFSSELPGASQFQIICAVGVGVLLAAACLTTTAQPRVDPPKEKYTDPPKICRQPYVE